MVDEELGKEGNPIILDSTPPRESFIASPGLLDDPPGPRRRFDVRKYRWSPVKVLEEKYR